MKPATARLLHKVAATLAPSQKNQEFLDNHFVDTGTAKWKGFRQKLRSKAFTSAVKQDDRADAKLKQHAESLHKHYTGKGQGFQVPSQSSSKNYLVKFHPDSGEFSCSCGDWVYKQSVKPKKQVCKHVTMLKYELDAQGQKLEKNAADLRALQWMKENL